MLLIQDLAKLAGVTVRTLHHYDHIGLLRPASHSASGYRLYGREEMLRLQQILFFRELKMPLKAVAKILDAEDFDLVTSLETHRSKLAANAARMQALMVTIDNTITSLKEQNMPLKDEDLYKGLSQAEIETIKQEVDEKAGSGEWDPQLVDQSRQSVSKLSKGAWDEIGKTGDEINADLAELMHLEPGADAVQSLIRRHHTWIENFYDCNRSVYMGLAEMYLSDERFRAHYDGVKPGLAKFLSAGMKLFAKRSLE